MDSINDYDTNELCVHSEPPALALQGEFHAQPVHSLPVVPGNCSSSVKVVLEQLCAWNFMIQVLPHASLLHLVLPCLMAGGAGSVVQQISSLFPLVIAHVPWSLHV